MKAMKSMRLAGAALILATSFGISSAMAQTAAPALKAPPKQIPAKAAIAGMIGASTASMREEWRFII